jgi:hypothetical protein
MAMLSRREVSSYTVDIFRSTASDFDRTIRLTLVGEEPNTIHMRYGGVVPANIVVSTSEFAWTVHFSLSQYDDMLHILQTERPVYFTAYEFPGPIQFAGITTDEEFTGEGFRDADLPQI